MSSFEREAGERGAGLVECVPNFSFSEDPELLEALSQLVKDGGGAVLDVSSDRDHNRFVFTWVARPQTVAAIAFRLIALASERIDLTHHRGVHPRIGACDVCPLVPLEGFPRTDCVELAHALGRRVGEELAIPVYFYGDAARSPEGRDLPALRRSGFVRTRTPDEGPARLHPTAGAIAIGVRSILIAFNVLLETADPAPAREIARVIRESSGGLAGIRALGLTLESSGISQVSVNLCDHEQTGLIELFERIEGEARKRGVAVRESELIGLAPRAALDRQIAARVRLSGFDPEAHVLEENLAKNLPALWK